MKTFYHVTKTENLEKIFKEGLLPKIGELSIIANECIERIYLFPNEEDMNTALSSWFGECFDEEDNLSSLKISLPDDFPIFEGEVEYEAYSYEIIPSEYISFFREE